MRCIYCKSKTPDYEHDYIGDHVFPKSFGCPNSWTLKCVCQECNNTLGGTIDRYLASDSIEGLWRLEHLGSKSGKEVRQKRIEIRVSEEGVPSEVTETRVWMDFKNRSQVVKKPQIVVQTESGAKEIFVVADMVHEAQTGRRTSIERILSLQEAGCQIYILQDPRMAFDNTLSVLQGIGLQFQVDEDGKFLIEADPKYDIYAKVDFEILRAVGKIGMNYFAYTCGCEEVLKDRYDELRSFVVGTLTYDRISDCPVLPLNGNILVDMEGQKTYIGRHVVTVEKREDIILATVALGNTVNMFYEIMLGAAEEYDLIGRGTVFSKDGSELIELRKILKEDKWYWAEVKLVG